MKSRDLMKNKQKKDTLRYVESCNSDMGLTPMDLFNDILTNENDLKNFLEQANVKSISTSSPGLVIQGKLCNKK